MRKASIIITLLTLLGYGSIQAQHYVGVRGGWGGGSARFTPVREGGTQWGFYSGGMSYKFYTESKFVGGVQVDLEYMGRGFMYDLRSKGDTSYHRSINTLEMPFMWQPHFYMAQRHIRVFFNLGVYLTYLMNSKYYYQSKTSGILERGDYEMKVTRDPRWGYGLCGGGGFGILAGRFEVTLEARYYFGYSDVLRTGSKYQGNPSHSPLDNINFSLGFYYRLSKEGIRAAPGPRVAQRMYEAQERKTERLLEKAKARGENPSEELLLQTPLDSIVITPPDTLTQPLQKAKKQKQTRPKVQNIEPATPDKKEQTPPEEQPPKQKTPRKEKRIKPEDTAPSQA